MERACLSLVGHPCFRLSVFTAAILLVLACGVLVTYLTSLLAGTQDVDAEGNHRTVDWSPFRATELWRHTNNAELARHAHVTMTACLAWTAKWVWSAPDAHLQRLGMFVSLMGIMFLAPVFGIQSARDDHGKVFASRIDRLALPWTYFEVEGAVTPIDTQVLLIAWAIGISPRGMGAVYLFLWATCGLSVAVYALFIHGTSFARLGCSAAIGVALALYARSLGPKGFQRLSDVPPLPGTETELAERAVYTITDDNEDEQAMEAGDDEDQPRSRGTSPLHDGPPESLGAVIRLADD
jgi:hypothetical protein